MRQFSRMSWMIQLILLSNLLMGQRGRFLKVDTTQYIEWNTERTVSWTDYVYRPAERAFGGGGFALTSVTHSVRGGISKGAPNFEVYVLFVKEQSWTSDSTDMALLAHEKLHFDIAELFARKLRKQIEVMGKEGVTDLKEYQKKIRYLLDQFKIKSSDYDKETVHGRIAEKQKEWQIYVSSEMQRLHKYM